MGWFVIYKIILSILRNAELESLEPIPRSGRLVHGFKRVHFSLANDSIDIMDLNIRRCPEPDFVVDIERGADRECSIGSNKVVSAPINTSKEFEPVRNCQKGDGNPKNPSGVWLEASPSGESLSETVVSHSCAKSQLGDCQNDPRDEA